MNSLPSSEFRKQFARLKSPVDVTVNGHVIGRWMPVEVAMNYVIGKDATYSRPVGSTEPWTSQPLRPVPKPSRR